MFFTIYKITNKLDGKYYIGKHQTKDLNDGYFGSGKVLKRAIKKHGIENFTKEILHVFDNEAEMNAKEKELVELHESSYNLCPGGQGGWGYINKNRSPEHNKKLGENLKKYSRQNGLNWGPINLKKAHQEGKIKYDTFTGRIHTEETKRKMSESSKGKVPWNKGKAWKEWHPNATKS
jgi:hypothetical protein